MECSNVLAYCDRDFGMVVFLFFSDEIGEFDAAKCEG